MVVRPFANLGAWTGVEIETIDACGHGRPRLQLEPVHRSRGRFVHPARRSRHVGFAHADSDLAARLSTRPDRRVLPHVPRRRQGKGRAVARALRSRRAPSGTRTIAEKMIRKLRAGMMPPPGAERPDDGDARRRSPRRSKRSIDRAAAAQPESRAAAVPAPQSRRVRARRFSDLLGLDVDVAAFLPPDTISHSFDNIADVQSLSRRRCSKATCARRRRSAALAVGDPDASAELDDLQGAAHGVADARTSRARRSARAAASRSCTTSRPTATTPSG